MNPSTTDTGLRDRIASLLSSYPAIGAAELDELIAFLKSGPAVDRGMLKGEPETGAIIRRVQDDHPAHFKLSVTRQLVVAAAIAIPFLLLCWLGWGIAAK